MRGFKVACHRHPINLEEPKWCFYFGSSITGVGEPSRRWWDTKEELVAELIRLGVDMTQVEVQDKETPWIGAPREVVWSQRHGR